MYRTEGDGISFLTHQVVTQIWRPPIHSGSIYTAIGERHGLAEQTKSMADIYLLGTFRFSNSPLHVKDAYKCPMMRK